MPMIKNKTSATKISRTKLSNIFPRQRLFQKLDNNWERSITWIDGPAGSGKTTLVASYLDARKLPCLWYQIDTNDADTATFFYYLELAAMQSVPAFKKGRRRTDCLSYDNFASAAACREEAMALRDGKVSLDKRYYWVDIWGLSGSANV